MKPISKIKINEAIEIARLFYDNDHLNSEKELKKYRIKTKTKLGVRFTNTQNTSGYSIELYCEDKKLIVRVDYFYGFDYPNLSQSIRIINKLKELGYSLSEFNI